VNDIGIVEQTQHSCVNYSRNIWETARQQSWSASTHRIRYHYRKTERRMHKH